MKHAFVSAIADGADSGLARPSDWNAPHVEGVNTVADAGSAETLSVATAPVHDVTLTEDCTLTLTGATNGQADSLVVMLRQDGVGSHTVTWPGSVEWPADTAPTLATAAGEVDVITLITVDGGTTWFGHHATEAPGGGLTQAYVGYNTIGAGWETMTARRHYIKQVTLANDCEIISISAYLQADSADTHAVLSGLVLSDNAGSPVAVLATGRGGGNTTYLDDANGGRWLAVPIGEHFAAGTYWIGFMAHTITGGSLQIAIDTTGGADHYYTPGADIVRDAGGVTVTDDTANRRSIRANTIR